MALDTQIQDYSSLPEKIQELRNKKIEEVEKELERLTAASQYFLFQRFGHVEHLSLEQLEQLLKEIHFIARADSWNAPYYNEKEDYYRHLLEQEKNRHFLEEVRTDE